MMTPATFQRIYRDAGPGLEHPASPGAVAAVIASMNAAGELNPFKVRLRFADGQAVTVAPKRRKP